MDYVQVTGFFSALVGRPSPIQGLAIHAESPANGVPVDEECLGNGHCGNNYCLLM